MPTTVNTPAAIPSFIEEMLAERQSHVEAIGVIDSTLSRVSSALGVDDVTSDIDKPVPVQPMGGVKSASVAKTAPVSKPSMSKTAMVKPAAGRRGKASKFGISAADFVVGFLQSAKVASTQDINKHWKESGRSGTADNAMSMLTKAKKLKRSPMPGGARGSRYTLV